MPTGFAGNKKSSGGVLHPEGSQPESDSIADRGRAITPSLAMLGFVSVGHLDDATHHVSRGGGTRKGTVFYGKAPLFHHAGGCVQLGPCLDDPN